MTGTHQRSLVACLGAALAIALLPLGRAAAQGGGTSAGAGGDTETTDATGTEDEAASPIAEDPPPDPEVSDAAVIDPAPVHTSSEDAAPGTSTTTEVYDHRSQVGVRIGAGVPYVFAVHYGGGARCEYPMGDSFCTRFGAPVLDTEISFGVSESAEIFFVGRFGLTEDQAAQSHQVILGLGIRGYTPAAEHLKIFLGARLLLDLTQSDDPQWSDVDFGIRGDIGLQWDILRYVGVYAQLGISFQFLRSFYFNPDLTAGVQARFP